MVDHVRSGVEAVAAPSTRPRVVVLESFRRPRGRCNPYTVQTVESLPPEATVRYFSWRRALLGRYDVFHVHWPEGLFREGSGLRLVLQYLLAAGLLVRLWATRTPVVRVRHNPSPHEPGPLLERWGLHLVDRLTASQIDIAGLAEPGGAATHTVLHGHYRDWFARYRVPAPLPGRLLFFGIIRPYKGVPALLDAFGSWAEPGVSLRIAGMPWSPAARAELQGRAARDPRVSTRLDWVGDDVLATEIGHAELVVLPYEEMGNSGSALLALSLDRPVLVPRSPSTSALAAEVGAGWVTLYDGPLTPGHLDSSLHGLRAGRHGMSPRPDLSRREWPALGEQLYRVLCASTQR